MSAQINLAAIDDIDNIIACNETVLPENYPRDFYETLLKHPANCSFVVKFSEKQIQQPPPVDENGNPTAVTTQNNVIVSKESVPDAEFAGYILAVVKPDAKGQLMVHILSLGVYKKFRRQQFATILMRCVETMAQERFPNTKYLMLNVRKHNKDAYQFYTKNGFSRAGMDYGYYKTSASLAKKFSVQRVEDSYVMKKYF